MLSSFLLGVKNNMDINQFISANPFTLKQATLFRAYIDAVYFTDQHETDAVLTHDFLRESARDCVRFYNVYAELIGDNVTQAGHDFWFTRNGHGVGFWDRPEIYGDFSQELSRAAEFAGEACAEFGGEK